MSKRKYFIASDLHLEFREGEEGKFWKAFPRYKGVDVCICAGDLTSFGISDFSTHRHFEGLCTLFRKVIYVPGNHEYYGTDTETVQKRFLDVERVFGSTIKVLRAGEPYTFEGQRFIGDTMWFPDKPEVHIYRGQVNDGLQIKHLFPWCFTQSHLFLSYLKQELREDDIVITHHVPNDVDTSIIWKNSDTQAYFLNSDCERYCMNPNSVMPKAWIYGHTHDKHDYILGNTRFICNPVGYPGENNQLPEAAEPAVYEL